MFDEPMGTIRRIFTARHRNLSGVFYDGHMSAKINAEYQRIAPRTDRDTCRKDKVGGSFPRRMLADSYDGADGIGPMEKRPRRTNFWNGVESEKSQPMPPHPKSDPMPSETNELNFLVISASCRSGAISAETSEAFRRPLRSVGAYAIAGGKQPRWRHPIGGRIPEPFSREIWGVGNESWVAAGDLRRRVCGRVSTLYVVAPRTATSKRWRGTQYRRMGWTREFLKEVVARGPGSCAHLRKALHHYAWNLAEEDPMTGTREKATR